MAIRYLIITSCQYVGIKYSNHPLQRKTTSNILCSTGVGECCCNADMSLPRPVGMNIYGT